MAMTATPGHGSAVEGTERFSSVRLGLTRISQVIDYSAAGVVVLSLAALFFAVLVNVVLRYAFGSGIAWAYEIHAILLPWMVAAGAVMAAARGRNIAVDVVMNMLPEAGRKVARIAVHALIVAMAVVVCESSLPIVKAGQYSRLAETGIPQLYGYASLLYLFAMVGVLSLLDALRLLLGAPATAADPADSKFS